MSATPGSVKRKNPTKPIAQVGEARRDPYDSITQALVRALEAGTRPWAKSWTSAGGSGIPRRWNGEAYKGINVIILWVAALEAGYRSSHWMTYKQAVELGGQVRRGEKGRAVCYYGTGNKDDSDADSGSSTFKYLKTFHVFNCEQIDGLPEKYLVPPAPVGSVSERIEEADALVSAFGITIKHGGNTACFIPAIDEVRMPEMSAFHSTELYYATLFHELGHATAASHRLDRPQGSQKHGDDAYAWEELIVELSAAMVGAELGFPPDHIEDHASYLAHWLSVLKADKRAIFSIAAKAQAIADYILRRSVNDKELEGE